MQYAPFIPYALLLTAVIMGRWTPSRWAAASSLTFVAAAVLTGLVFKAVTPIALIPIGLLALFIWLPRKFETNKFATTISYGFFTVLAFALAHHFVPGFHNLPVFSNEQFSPDSAPFNMYLNFDKTLIGLFIYVFFLKSQEAQPFTLDNLRMVVKILVMLAVVTIPVALAISYVRVDIKFPELGWLWVLNNLFFVCLAEEALFRGFIQNGLTHLLPKTKRYSFAAIGLAAVVFGLAHYKGGPVYIAFAAVAGLFYGFAFYKTKRLESAILVHFGFNLIHFLLFSYPNLIAEK